MYIHEYQAKALLKTFGVKVLKGYLVEKIEDMNVQVKKLDTTVKVVKAQIHSGGRGKAGGVKVVTSLDDAITAGHNLLGKKLITYQNAPHGQIVNKLYIEEGCQIKREFYLSMMIDRAENQILLIASKEGGVEIEETAKTSPDAIAKIGIDPLIGVCSFHIRHLAKTLDLDKHLWSKLDFIIRGLYQCFIEKDVSLIEINPLVLTEDEDILALDAKMQFDENALFRHPDIEALKDFSEEDPKETKASAYGLSYIALDGNIACMVNGAGLAMATMDAIHYAGGSPANFLDVGGSASLEMILRAFEIILSDDKVKGIFINIFGGIMHCDTIANGIIEATKHFSYKIPLAVRLEGTNADVARAMLKSSGIDIIAVETMEEGATKIVEAVQKGGQNA